MSVEISVRTPQRFLKATAVATIIRIVSNFIYSIPAIWYLWHQTNLSLLFGISALLALSMAGTQQTLKSLSNGDIQNPFKKKWLLALIILFNFPYYSGIIWVSAVLGNTVTSQVGFSFSLGLGTIITVIYSFWEVYTRTKGYPLSIGGIIFFALAIIFATFEILRGDPEDDDRGFREKFSDGLQAIVFSENEPSRFAIQQLV